MYAIVETSGKQYRCEPGSRITVDRVAAEVGTTLTLDRVLLVGGDALKVGTPTVQGAAVTAKVVEHSLADKAVRWQYKQRKRTRRSVGYRARMTTLEIVEIKA